MSSSGFKGLNKYKKTVKTKGDEKLQKVAIDAFEILKRRSPVLTGQFRANWKGSNAKPDPRFTQYIKGSTRGKENSVAAPSISNLKDLKMAKIGTDYYIQNDTPYGSKIEAGETSARNGVLHITKREVQSKLK
jgi:hypothetical protein